MSTRMIGGVSLVLFPESEVSFFVIVSGDVNWQVNLSRDSSCRPPSSVLKNHLVSRNLAIPLFIKTIKFKCYEKV